MNHVFAFVHVVLVALASAPGAAFSLAQWHINTTATVVTFIGSLALFAAIWRIAPRRIWAAYTAAILAEVLALIAHSQFSFMVGRSGGAFYGIVLGMLSAAGVTYWALRLATPYLKSRDTAKSQELL